MKHILCFGDSLTWGYNPVTSTRYAYEERWTGMLQKILGSDYRIIEEGLNGRTTAFDDPILPYKNGNAILPMLLDTHAPLDLIVIMLGTNDMQTYYQLTAKESARGYAVMLLNIMKSAAGPEGSTPKTLLLAPPWIQAQDKHLMGIFFPVDVNDSQKFAQYYQQVANANNVNFLDTAAFLQTCSADGVHLDLAGNAILAKHLAPKIKEICGK